MIIKRVRLKNFISHADTSIEFPLGVTVLIGPNGAGKTSVIDGIIFALFGIKVRGEKVTDVIRRGADSAEVEVVFEVDGREYTLRRERKSRTTEAILLKDGIPIARGQEVSAEIPRLLRMDKETIVNSIFVRQGEVASLVDAEPSQRKQLMGRLIGLDRLERAWGNMREVVSHFEDKAKEYDVVKKELELKQERKAEISREIEEIEKKLSEIRKELEVAEKELDEAEKEREIWRKKRDVYHDISEKLSGLRERERSLERDVKRLEKDIAEAEEAKRKVLEIEPEIKKIELLEEYISALNEKKRLEEKLDRVKGELRKVKDLVLEVERTKDAYNRYIELERELRDLESRLKELQKVRIDYERIKAEIESTQKRTEELKSEIARIESKALEILPEATVEAKEEKIRELSLKIEELDNRREALQNEIGSVKSRISEIEEYMQILGESAECPVCKSPLTPEHRDRVKAGFEREKEDLLRRLGEIESEIGQLSGERRTLEKELDRVKALDVERLEKLKEDLSKFGVMLEVLFKEKKSIEIKLAALVEIEMKISEIKRELDELREDYEKHVAAKRALEGERSIDEIEAELANLENELGEVKRLIESLESKLGRVDDPEKELKRLKKLKEEYDTQKVKAEKMDEIRVELSKTKKDLEAVIQKIKSLEAELENLNYSEEEYRKVEERYNSASEEVTRLKTLLNETEEREREKKQELEKVEREIKVLEDKLESLERVREFVGKLQKIRDALSKNGVQRILRQRVAPIISDFARDYIEHFNLDITDISVNEDFDVTVIKKGGEISVKSISGGEKVAVAIALRLAIAKALAGRISTVIMDEPTTHLDEERRRELVEIMKNFFREGSAVPQMVIVTHHQELEEVADTVYRIEKVDGVSEVVGEA